MKHVFILGAYGQNNLGDEALLEVFLEQFAGWQVAVNSAQPKVTADRYGIKVVATYSAGLPRMARPRVLLQSDLLVFGGGSLLKETEGNLVERLFYFAKIFALLIFGKLFGRPTAMLGVGIGPLSQPLYKTLSRLAANWTDLVCVRDSESRDLLLAIGVKRPVHLTADPVFILAPGQVAQSTASASPPIPTQPYVVVIPRYSMPPAQQTALAAACDELVEQRGVRILFVPFQFGYIPKYDDLPVTKAIHAQMRRAEAAEIWISEEPGAVSDLISQAQMVISVRLHGLIFAAIRGVASVALSYEVKMRSFMAEIGQSWASVELAEATPEKLHATLEQAWARRPETQQQVTERVQVLQSRARQNFELVHELTARPRSSSMLTGSAIFFASAMVVNIGNYVFNLVLGRWLGPAAFADLSLMVTLILVASFITTAINLITAKFSAAYTANGHLDKVSGLRQWLGRWAWAFGAVVLVTLALGAGFWSQFFHTVSFWPFVILGIGMPLYIVQAVNRGILQGQTRFIELALSYQAEMWVRLVAAAALVAIGFGVNGAVIGLTLSFLGTWLVSLRAGVGLPSAVQLDAAERRAALLFAAPTLAALVSQILINNSDILIVKHFFDPTSAGQYAALALIGRVVFFATWSVVTVVFPIVAQKHERHEPHRYLLGLGLALVGLVSAIIILGAILAPDFVVRVLFGEAYLSIAPLLALYALATALYALANVVITYRLSIGVGGGSVLAVLAGVGQVAGLWFLHSTLSEVVLVQVYLMGGLLLTLLVWDWGLSVKERRLAQRTLTEAK